MKRIGSRLKTFLGMNNFQKLENVASMIEVKNPEREGSIRKTEFLSGLLNLELSFYQSRYDDLSGLSENHLIDHYFEYGYREGRMNDSIAIRENFLKSLNQTRMLEIGPFCNPCLTGDNVDHADILSSAELKERAKAIGISSDGVPEIKHVLKDGTLKGVKETYDLVFSSHNLEHQPDLIAHLNEVSSILNEDGCFALIVPNARYCFDASLPLSKISEIFNAHQEKRKVHTLGSVIEHYALTTHNDSGKHWDRNTESSMPKLYDRVDEKRVAAAISEFNRAEGSYIDVHAWQFDPLSLSDILNCLINLEIINFSKVVCNGPVTGRNEFTLVLKK